MIFSKMITLVWAVLLMSCAIAAPTPQGGVIGKPKPTKGGAAGKPNKPGKPLLGGIFGKPKPKPTKPGKALPADRVIIGYRSVSPEHAAMYNQKHKFDKKNMKPSLVRGRQIGVGVYTTPGPGEFVAEKGNWHCVITGDKVKVAETPKLWLEEGFWWRFDGTKSTQPVIDWVDKISGGKFEAHDGLALSLIDQRGDRNKGVYYVAKGAKQLLIPTQIAWAETKDLGLRVECASQWQQLPYQTKVDYSAWPNVYGKPQ